MSSEQKQTVKVLLADDHPIVMAGFSMTLNEQGIEVVGTATTPKEAVAKYLELLPDVLLLDVGFGEALTGFDAAKEIWLNSPDANIVFLSQFERPNLIKEAYNLGARAFLTKDCSPDDLVMAVTQAADKNIYFLPQVAQNLAKLSVSGDLSPRSQLDTRELEIFILMAKGLTNVEMAGALDLSPKTISMTSHSIKSKLGMHRAADITRLALKHALIEL